MRKKPSFLEINGQQYNATTGQVLAPARRAGETLRQVTRGPVIDGFINKVTPRGGSVSHHKKPAAQTFHQRTRHAKTLMRETVTKPKPPVHKTPGSHNQDAKPLSAVSSKLSQAVNVAKSAHVRHFSQRKPPSEKQLLSGEVVAAKSSAGGASLAIVPAPSILSGVSQQQIEHMLDEALIRADSHKKAISGKFSRLRYKGLLIALIAAVLIFVGAFLCWQYIPHASMKIASIRANVRGSLPAYVPSGFKTAGPIDYKSGSVQLTYKAIDGRTFTIAQEATSWDSQSLKDNALPNKSQIQTSEINGNTVYIYDDENNATWINKGVRYTIKDKAKLSSDQLLKIAQSL